MDRINKKPNWQKLKFSDVIDINPKVSLQKSEEYYFLDMKSITPGKRTPEEYQRKAYTSGGSKFCNNSTLMARITPCLENGKIAFVQNLDEKCGFGSTEFIVFKGKNNISDDKFIYYLVSSDEVRSFSINNMYGSSGRQRVDHKAYDELFIDLPPISEQHRIASILSAFDDKIELNNKINKTLEQMAQAIFKEWFVEFKFPGNEKVNMVGSKSGNISEGWKNLKLREYVKYVRGRSYTSRQIAGNNGFAFINLKSIQEGGGYRYDGIKNYDGPVNENQYLNTDDIIVGITETTQKRAIIGHVARIPNIDLGKTTFSCDIVKLESKDLNNLYLYSLLRYGNFSKITKEKANGTNVLHLNPEDILEYEFIKPTNDIIQNFVSKIDTVYKKMDQIYLENQTLSSLRDTLLPKLMSGEVKINV